MNASYQVFIDGIWREGSDNTKVPVINPATEEVFAEVSWGTPEAILAYTCLKNVWVNLNNK